MGKEIKTRIQIHAPVNKVWGVLSNFSDYKTWNPFITSISGDMQVGSQIEAQIEPPEAKSMTFKPTVLVCYENKEFRWLGSAGLKGIFDGEHYFLLEELNGVTMFTHGEKFSGLLIPFMGKMLEKTKRGFEKMNEALKSKCEE